jgi:hypothetical protein
MARISGSAHSLVCCDSESTNPVQPASIPFIVAAVSLPFLLGWVPSAVAMRHLWHRQDLGYGMFGFWSLVLLYPWTGAIVYAAWAILPILTAFMATIFGGFSVQSIVKHELEYVLPAQGWDEVVVDTLDEGFEYKFDGLSTIKPHYSYSYQGKRYVGDRLDLTPAPWFASEFEQRGPPFRAFVNPERPEESILQREFPKSMQKWVLLGPVILVAGIWHFWFGLRSRFGSHGRRRQAPTT